MDHKRNLLLLGAVAAGLLLSQIMTGVAGRWPQTERSRGFASGRSEASILAVPVKSFVVDHASMADALRKLRGPDVEHVVIGFERIPHREEEKSGPISLAVTHGTLGGVIERLCQADPRYEYQVIKGSIIEVRPKGVAKDPHNLLNMKIQHYKIDDNITAGAAIQRIDEDAPELREFLRRKAEEWAKRTGKPTGFPGSITSGNMPPLCFTLDLHDVTVRQILDAISLKSIEMFKKGKNYGPVGWEYDFIIDPNAPTGLGGYPKWTAF